jgi:hypothetical protein
MVLKTIQLPFFPVIRADEHDAICDNVARYYFCPRKTAGGRTTGYRR